MVSIISPGFNNLNSSSESSFLMSTVGTLDISSLLFSINSILGIGVTIDSLFSSFLMFTVGTLDISSLLFSINSIVGIGVIIDSSFSSFLMSIVGTLDISSLFDLIFSPGFNNFNSSSGSFDINLIWGKDVINL